MVIDLYWYIFLCAVILILFFYGKEYVRYKYLLGKIPASKKLPILGNLIELISLDYAPFFRSLRKRSLTYAPVYTSCILDYTAVHIVSPEEFEIIAGSMKNLQKGMTYRLFESWLGDGLLISTGAKWQTRRKILTPAFHFSTLQKFVKIFNEETEELVDDLKGTDLNCLNIVPVVTKFTLKAITETAMSTKLDFSVKDDYNFVTATHNMGKVLLERLLRPWYYLKFPYYFSNLGRTERRNLNVLHGFCNRVIDNKSRNFDANQNLDRKKLAMLDILLKAKNNEGLIDDQGIKDEVNTFMFEGHDTTAMSICFTMMLLAFHQEIQELVYQEIIAVLGNNKHPTITELNELKNMERCIKESLRLYPSVPTITRHLEEDTTLSQGYVVPKGSLVFLEIFDMHRNPRYWPEPDKFDPDRFLPENCANRHPFLYVPFSAGPRNCIGQKFAMLEQKAALCGILRNFKLEAIDTPQTIELIQDLVVRPKDEILNMKFTRRD